jgi:hypothetical protein
MIVGPLQQLLLGIQHSDRRRRSQLPHLAPASGPNPPVTPGHMLGKRRFLLEFEWYGDIPTAARKAQCTPAEVRLWRADPMFDRDFVLAAFGYIKTLERMLAEAAETRPERDAAHIRHLLATKPRYLGDDGRIDAVAWRNALRACAAALELDLSTWEPCQPAQACA